MLENGYYWVKADSDPDWQPAELRDGEWWIIGSDMSGPVQEVGPRLQAPA